MNWRYGLTPEEITEIEMRRGAEVAQEKHGSITELLARQFDPDYKPPKPTHHVDAQGKEYNRRLRESNKDREDFK